MTQNIEQRTEVAVTKYEKASDVVEQLGNTDSTVNTPTGPRDSFPKLSREIGTKADGQRTDIQHRADHQNVEIGKEFQSRFTASQNVLPWHPKTQITQSLQRYYTGVSGESSYVEWLPDPEQLPFETSDTFIEDQALNRWSDALVATKDFSKYEDKKRQEGLTGLIQQEDVKVGVVIKPSTNAVLLDGNARVYPLSRELTGAVTAVNIVAKPYSITTDSGTAILMDIKYWRPDEFNIKAFWAVGDGVFDNTPSLEEAIYAASGGWEWQGSVNATNAFRNIKGRVFVPAGKFRYTRSLRLPPCITIEGVGKAGFWDENATSELLADFTRVNTVYKYALDTAPYDSEGNVTWGKLAGRQDWDYGLFTGHHLITIRHLSVNVKNPDVNLLDGVLNLAISSESNIELNSLSGAACGIWLSCSWAGKVAHNNVVGNKCIGIVCGSDVTTYVVENNYITVRLTWGDNDFNGPSFPSSEYLKKTAGIVGRYANPKIRDNTIENCQHGIRVTNMLGGTLDSNYMEKVTEYGYVTHTSYLKIICSTWFNSSPARLAHVNGSESAPVDIDISSLGSTMSDVDHPIVSSYAKVMVTGGAGRVLGQKRSGGVNYEHTSVNGPEYCDIYMSKTGDDTNHGYHANWPVKTWQEAVLRCRSDKKNRIFIKDGETVGTRRYYEDTTDTRFRVYYGLDIQVIGSADNRPTLAFSSDSSITHSIPMQDCSVTFENVNIQLPVSYPAADYKPAFRGQANLMLNFRDLSINGSASTMPYLMGCNWGESSITTVNFRNCSLSNFRLNDDTSGDHDNAWIENSASCTVTNVQEGDSGMKIKSKLFP